MFRYLGILLLVGCSGGAFKGEEHIWSGVDDSPLPVGPTSVDDARRVADAYPDEPKAAPASAPRAREPVRPDARDEDAGAPSPEPVETDAAPPPFPQPVETDAGPPAREGDAGAPVKDPCVGWTAVVISSYAPQHCGANGPDADGYRRFEFSRDCVNAMQSVTQAGQALPTLAPGVWYLRSDRGVVCR